MHQVLSDHVFCLYARPLLGASFLRRVTGCIAKFGLALASMGVNLISNNKWRVEREFEWNTRRDQNMQDPGTCEHG